MALEEKGTARQMELVLDVHQRARRPEGRTESVARSPSTPETKRRHYLPQEPRNWRGWDAALARTRCRAFIHEAQRLGLLANVSWTWPDKPCSKGRTGRGCYEICDEGHQLRNEGKRE